MKCSIFLAAVALLVNAFVLLHGDTNGITERFELLRYSPARGVGSNMRCF